MKANKKTIGENVAYRFSLSKKLEIQDNWISSF